MLRLATFPTALSNTVISTTPRLIPLIGGPADQFGVTLKGTARIFRRERVAGTAVFLILMVAAAGAPVWSAKRRAIIVG